MDLRSALMEGEGVFAQEGFKGEGPGKAFLSKGAILTWADGGG